MYEITGLTNDAKQTMKLVAGTGSLITLTLEYCSSQRGWWYSVDYGDISLSKRRLVASPNTIRQFRGVLPFGILCNVTDGQEPVYLDDFSSGRVKLYILDETTDIDAMEEFIAS